MRNIAKLGVLVATVALATAACSSSAGDGKSGGAGPSASGSVLSGTPYVIGAPSQLSGPNKSTYAGLSMTLTAWEKSVNAAGGINGHPVKVIAKDTAGNAAQGLSVTKSLVQDDHAMAIIDSDPSIEQAILPYLTEQKIPALNALALYPFWNSTPGFFALGMPYAPDGLTAALKILQSVKITSLASVVCAEVAACSAPAQVLVGAAGKYDISYKGTLTVSASAASYTAQCLQLKGNGTESVMLGVSLAVSQKVVADCTAQGYNPTYYFNFQSFSPALAQIPGIKAYGLSPVQLWYSDAPAMSAFTAAVKQYGEPDKADMTSMFAWTALEAFKAAAIKAGGEPSAEAVMSGLNSLTDFDAGGLMPSKVSFQAGAPSPKINCYFVGQIEGGKMVELEGTSPQCLN